jgi:hypothetical protein
MMVSTKSFFANQLPMFTSTVPDTEDNMCVLPLAEFDWFELSTLPRFTSTLRRLESFPVFLLKRELLGKWAAIVQYTEVKV